MVYSDTVLQDRVGIDAIQLSVDNMEEVEVRCNGRIRGIKLPPEQRIVQFDDPDLGEQDLPVGHWLVRFSDGHDTICQVWSNCKFNKIFRGTGL
jgi:hypothetical protein